MPIPIYQVDAFADRPFVGNPAAVVLLDAPCDDRWMQNVAGEMNLAETAFVLREGDGWRLRWFTPAIEVDLCGHATLATAHTLWETGRLPHGDMACFRTRSGLLTAVQHGELIELDFPLVPVEPVEPPAGLAEALGVRPEWAGRAGVESAGVAGFRGAASPVASGFPGLARHRWSGRHRHSAGCRGRLRFRLALFRAGGGDRRRPGDRLGSLRPRSILERTPRPRRAARISGVGSRRLRARAGGRRSGEARWDGGDGAARGVDKVTG